MSELANGAMNLLVRPDVTIGRDDESVPLDAERVEVADGHRGPTRLPVVDAEQTYGGNAKARERVHACGSFRYHYVHVGLGQQVPSHGRRDQHVFLTGWTAELGQLGICADEVRVDAQLDGVLVEKAVERDKQPAQAAVEPPGGRIIPIDRFSGM